MMRMNYPYFPEESTVYGSRGKASSKDQETLKVDLNLLQIRRKLWTKTRLFAMDARNQGTTRMNVLSLRRVLWQHGMTQTQKKKILKRSMLPLHSWPEPRMIQKSSQPQRQ